VIFPFPSIPRTFAVKKSATATKPRRDASAVDPRADLLYQALETEMGGVELYTAALKCVQNDELRAEWEKYLEQTKVHVTVMRDVCTGMGLDPDRETPGRQVVRHIGKSLVKAMQMAAGAGAPGAAEVVAAECVTLAETKDHANWGLIGKLAKAASGKEQALLRDAYERVEDEEDEHLYHSEGWARELALQALGLPAQLPPPEEEDDVHSQAEAARAKKRSAS
jgi:hypothetical protein